VRKKQAQNPRVFPRNFEPFLSLFQIFLLNFEHHTKLRIMEVILIFVLNFTINISYVYKMTLPTAIFQ